MGGRSENGHHDSVPGSRRRRLRAAPCLGCDSRPAAEKTRPLYRFSKVRSRKALLCTRRLSANSRQRQRCREKAASVPTNAEKNRVLYQHAAVGDASRNIPRYSGRVFSTGKPRTRYNGRVFSAGEPRARYGGRVFSAWCRAYANYGTAQHTRGPARETGRAAS